MTKYIYDGDQCIAEYDGSNNLLRKYIHGLSIDEPICMIEAAEGEEIDEIVRRIRGTAKNRYRDGLLAKSRREIESVVRTSVSGVVNNVRQATYRANADVVKAVQWVATGSVKNLSHIFWE